MSVITHNAFGSENVTEDSKILNKLNLMTINTVTMTNLVNCYFKKTNHV